MHPRHPLEKLLFLVALCLTTTACFLGCRGERSPGDNSTTPAPEQTAHIEFPEGDPNIAPELGGPGFTGEGWTTSSPGPLGDPKAVKGGVISAAIPNWPENLRRFGTGSNTWLNYLIRDLCYESLCSSHPRTLETLPGLASHWKISDDQMTFEFRIDPRAHWSDGKPVVADDWVATYRLINDDTLIEPMGKATLCDKMHEPKVVSKYMLEVQCKERDWRNFLAVSSLTPLPAHEIGEMTGEEFLEKYNFRLTATSGPYILYPQDVKKNESVIITRRTDYWAKDDAANIGINNFDKIRFVVVRDHRLAFDKVCKGELDYQSVNTAAWWVEDIKPLEAYKNGQLIRREFYTKFPKGFQGQVFNMRKPPLDDVRVRKALTHLYDRATMLKKFAFDQYSPLKSYYPGGDAENINNGMIEFNPNAAVRLLTEAGWTERGPDGVLVKDGMRLSVTVMYRGTTFEKYLTSYQEACRGVGVELVLKLVTPETHWKNMMERSFQMASMAWGAILYPNPKSTWSSEMADKPGSNNLPGLKSKLADELIEQYDQEFDLTERNRILREMDAEIHSHHPYALEWYLASERVMYWNKFGMPEYGLDRYHEWEDAFQLWWYDEEKAQRLKKTLRTGERMGPIPELQVRYWDDHLNPLTAAGDAETGQR